MKRLFALTILALTLSACGTLDGKFENRLACAVAKDKAYVVSEYGSVGISSTISSKDAIIVCK